MQRIITTVSLNPALDRTLLVPGFSPGATNRVASSRLDVGGKGINVARVVRALGGAVQVVGFLGEANARPIQQCLADRAIPAHLVLVPGETRVNIKVIDPDTDSLTEINEAGFTVKPHHLHDLMAQVERALATSSLLVLSGSLPAGVPVTIYRDLIQLASAAGVATILDADGEALSLGLTARPTLIKPNQGETERLLGRPLGTRAAILRAAADLRQMGAGAVVVSSGGEGAAYVDADTRWWATPPAIDPGSTVGAGDSMVAGLALALSRGLPPAEALRLATAAGTAAALLPGTQICSAADVEALLPQVHVQPAMEVEQP